MASPLNLNFLIRKRGYHIYLRVNRIRAKIHNCFIKHKVCCSKNKRMVMRAEAGTSGGRCGLLPQAPWGPLFGSLQHSFLPPPQVQFQLSGQPLSHSTPMTVPEMRPCSRTLQGWMNRLVGTGGWPWGLGWPQGGQAALFHLEYLPLLDLKACQAYCSDP